MNDRAYPMRRAFVELRLDEVDSSGKNVSPLDSSNARPSAVSLSPGMVWFGFVLNEAAGRVIQPGEQASCWISFLNHEGAMEAFPPGASFLFGDGVSTRGVINIVAFDSAL